MLCHLRLKVLLQSQWSELVERETDLTWKTLIAVTLVCVCVHSCVYTRVCTLVCALKVYLNRHANSRKKLLVPCSLDPPNPKCYVCAARPEIALRLNVYNVTVKLLEDKVSSLTVESLLIISCESLLVCNCNSRLMLSPKLSVV